MLPVARSIPQLPKCKHASTPSSSRIVSLNTPHHLGVSSSSRGYHNSSFSSTSVLSSHHSPNNANNPRQVKLNRKTPYISPIIMNGQKDVQTEMKSLSNNISPTDSTWDMTLFSEYEVQPVNPHDEISKSRAELHNADLLRRKNQAHLESLAREREAARIELEKIQEQERLEKERLKNLEAEARLQIELRLAEIERLKKEKLNETKQKERELLKQQELEHILKRDEELFGKFIPVTHTVDPLIKYNVLKQVVERNSPLSTHCRKEQLKVLEQLRPKVKAPRIKFGTYYDNFMKSEQNEAKKITDTTSETETTKDTDNIDSNTNTNPNVPTHTSSDSSQVDPVSTSTSTSTSDKSTPVSLSLEDRNAFREQYLKELHAQAELDPHLQVLQDPKFSRPILKGLIRDLTALIATHEHDLFAINKLEPLHNSVYQKLRGHYSHLLLRQYFSSHKYDDIIVLPPFDDIMEVCAHVLTPEEITILHGFRRNTNLSLINSKYLPDFHTKIGYSQAPRAYITENIYKYIPYHQLYSEILSDFKKHVMKKKVIAFFRDLKNNYQYNFLLVLFGASMAVLLHELAEKDKAYKRNKQNLIKLEKYYEYIQSLQLEALGILLHSQEDTLTQLKLENQHAKISCDLNQPLHDKLIEINYLIEKVKCFTDLFHIQNDIEKSLRKAKNHENQNNLNEYLKTSYRAITSSNYSQLSELAHIPIPQSRLTDIHPDLSKCLNSLTSTFSALLTNICVDPELQDCQKRVYHKYLLSLGLPKDGRAAGYAIVSQFKDIESIGGRDTDIGIFGSEFPYQTTVDDDLLITYPTSTSSAQLNPRENPIETSRIVRVTRRYEYRNYLKEFYQLNCLYFSQFKLSLNTMYYKYCQARKYINKKLNNYQDSLHKSIESKTNNLSPTGSDSDNSIDKSNSDYTHTFYKLHPDSQNLTTTTNTTNTTNTNHVVTSVSSTNVPPDSHTHTNSKSEKLKSTSSSEHPYVQYSNSIYHILQGTKKKIDLTNCSEVDTLKLKGTGFVMGHECVLDQTVNHHNVCVASGGYPQTESQASKSQGNVVLTNTFYTPPYQSSDSTKLQIVRNFDKKTTNTDNININTNFDKQLFSFTDQIRLVNNINTQTNSCTITRSLPTLPFHLLLLYRCKNLNIHSDTQNLTHFNNPFYLEDDTSSNNPFYPEDDTSSRLLRPLTSTNSYLVPKLPYLLYPSEPDSNFINVLYFYRFLKYMKTQHYMFDLSQYSYLSKYVNPKLYSDVDIIEDEDEFTESMMSYLHMCLLDIPSVVGDDEADTMSDDIYARYVQYSTGTSNDH